MSDKDKIKELFQKELGNYKAKVDPNLWKGIQSGLGSAGAAGVASSIGLAGKIIIGASIAAAITVGTILMVNNSKETTYTNEKLKVELKTNDNKEVKEDKLEDVNSKIRNQNKDQKIEEKNQLNTKDQIEDKNSDDVSSIPIINTNKVFACPPRVVPIKETNKTSENTNSTYQGSDERINKDPSITQPEKSPESISNLSKVKLQVLDQKNQFISFSAIEVPEGSTIRWNFGDGDYGYTLNQEHFYTEAGDYHVELTVTIDHQRITKTVQISINIKGEIGTLPNVFTPNGDGRNDVFFIESKHLKSFQLTVMDKNQNVVYSTNDPKFQWNGFDKFGNIVNDGDYIYIIVAEDEAGNTINKYQKLTIQR